MASLSVDSLYHVSAYSNHRSLRNFCLVNRQCHDLSRKHLYRTMTVSFSSWKTLNSAVNQRNCILQRTQSFHHVQHVKVLPSDPDQHSVAQILTDCGDGPREPWKYCWLASRERKIVEQDSQWQNLSCLIKKTSSSTSTHMGLQRADPRIYVEIHPSQPSSSSTAYAKLLVTLPVPVFCWTYRP